MEVWKDNFQVPGKKGNASFLFIYCFQGEKQNGSPANKVNYRKAFIQMHILTNAHLL